MIDQFFEIAVIYTDYYYTVNTDTIMLVPAPPHRPAIRIRIPVTPGRPTAVEQHTPAEEERHDDAAAHQHRRQLGPNVGMAALRLRRRR